MGAVLHPTTHPGDLWAMSQKTFLVVTTGGEGAPGTWWREARDAAKPPTGHRKTPRHKNKELSGLKCQYHQGWRNLPIRKSHCLNNHTNEGCLLPETRQIRINGG